MLVIITGTDPASRRGGIGFAIPGYLAALKEVGISCISIPTYHPETSGGKWKLWLTSIPRIVREIKKSKISKNTPIVYAHAGAGVSLFREGLLLIIVRFFGAKTVLQLHATEVEYYLRQRVESRLFKILVSGANALCVLTPWWHRRLTSAGIKKNIAVIPNPLPSEWEERANAPVVWHEIPQIGLKTILSISRLEAGKGIELVVDVMQYLPGDVRLVVAGDGGQLDALKKRAKRLGVQSRVSFVGWASGAIKEQLIKEGDIFCLPSSLDSFGMGFIESMANGLPVVALNWGPIGDVVPHGRAGILIDEPDPKILAEAIESLEDPALRHRMGGEGKRWVLNKFSAKKVGNDLKAVFEELVKE